MKATGVNFQGTRPVLSILLNNLLQIVMMQGCLEDQVKGKESKHDDVSDTLMKINF